MNKSEENKDKISPPQSLIKFREKQKEIREREKEKNDSLNNRSNKNVIDEDILDQKDNSLQKLKEEKKQLKIKEFNESKSTLSDKDINTNKVNMIEESITAATYIINSVEGEVSIGENFSKFFHRKNKLLKISEKELDIDFNIERNKYIINPLGKALSEIISQTSDIKSDDLEKKFSLICKQVMEHKEFWSGNEKSAPLLAIRARVSTLEASLSCWSMINEFPFTRNIELTSLRVFSFIISLSRDIALNWEEEMNSIERQQLYVSIVPLISKIAKKQWEISVLNELNNSQHSLDRIRDDIKTKLMNDMKNKEPNINIQKMSDISDHVLNKMIEITDNYSEDYSHLKPSIVQRIKKTILFSIKDKIIESINQDNKKYMDNDLNDIIEDIFDNMDIIISSYPPNIEVSLDIFNENLKNGVIQMWGAAQGLYKFRSQ